MVLAECPAADSICMTEEVNPLINAMDSQDSRLGKHPSTSDAAAAATGSVRQLDE